jgi:hypothetical protein
VCFYLYLKGTAVALQEEVVEEVESDVINSSSRDRSDSHGSSDRRTSRKRDREEVAEKSEPVLKKAAVMEEGEEEDEVKEAVHTDIPHDNPVVVEGSVVEVTHVYIHIYIHI